jgi:hypothetical protein
MGHPDRTPRVVVLGATGVFGRLLARELANDFDVAGASRATGADLRDPVSIARLARGAHAVLCAAGPFQAFDPRCVRAAVDEGAHWLDIADDPRWFFALTDDRELDARARAQGVAVVSGLSTMPAISGALVRRAGVADATITLGIGNRNAKGPGSIASALAGDGRTIITPDRELLRRELGIDAQTLVRFQLPGASLLFRALGFARSLAARQRVGRIMSILTKPVSRFGSDASYVEAVTAKGRARVDGRGQRLAILPIAIVARRLDNLRGVLTPSQAIDADDLLRALSDAGCAVASSSSASRTSSAAPA